MTNTPFIPFPSCFFQSFFPSTHPFVHDRIHPPIHPPSSIYTFILLPSLLPPFLPPFHLPSLSSPLPLSLPSSFPSVSPSIHPPILLFQPSCYPPLIHPPWHCGGSLCCRDTFPLHPAPCTIASPEAHQSLHLDLAQGWDGTLLYTFRHGTSPR